MKLHILTIVLNGMPWIAAQWTNLVKTDLDWHWHIVEGAAANTNCTSWCKRIGPQRSVDGTGEIIRHLRNNSRVSVYRKPMWDGKIEMVNAPLEHIKEESVLLQMDSDEIWTAPQLNDIVRLFSWTDTHAYFWCRYFFGPDIVMTTRNCYGNNPAQDWKRAWRFKPGDRFEKHEPPILTGERLAINHHTTERAGLVFDHYGYAMEPQVRFKEDYYGYAGAVKGWQRLQDNDKWPVRLCDFLPWVKDETCLAERL